MVLSLSMMLLCYIARCKVTSWYTVLLSLQHYKSVGVVYSVCELCNLMCSFNHGWNQYLKQFSCQILKWWCPLLPFCTVSESSMFVSKTRFILKTCGTTLLLEALKELFQLAKKFCNYEVEVRKCFFSVCWTVLFLWCGRECVLY